MEFKFSNLKTLLLASAVLFIASCGGGGGTSNPDWTPSVFEPEQNFKNFCAIPRNDANFDDQPGNTTLENFWLRSWSNNTYFWYDEIIDQNPGGFSSTQAYFEVLKTNAVTASGNDRDRFHFTFDTEEWIALSQSGVSAGYGADFRVLESLPPREIIVSFTEANSPASMASLTRGAKVISIDGVDVENGNDVDTLNAGLFPSAAGESHSFTVRDAGSNNTSNITLTSENITSDPVPIVDIINPGSDNIGYLLFNSHIATAEVELVNAVDTLVTAGISDLVLDLRYNGGGLLAIASQLAYMIAGPTATNGRVFETLAFNDKHTLTNPVTGEPLTPTPFIDTTVGFSTVAGVVLPSLNLPRVFVLTSASTCSASEAIINGLRGIGLQVIMIGDTTCGKPYGFYPTDNCSTTYFTVQFRGENDVGFGDYADGFSPMNTQGTTGETVEGCSVEDDFDHQLGDAQEGMLAVALDYRNGTPCPAPAFKVVASAPAIGVNDSLRIDSKAPGKFVLENRFMTTF
jgi:carboxyl-terminal processing protease